MPDDNNQTTSTTTDTSQTGVSPLPTPPKPVVEEVPTSEKPGTESTPPTMGENLPPDTLPPLPTTEEVPPTLGTESVPTPSIVPPADEPESVGSAAPNDTNTTEGLDIPPVITGGGKPKGRFGKKAIATILGVLLLVGGIGAGVTLVQRQQDIRERAAVVGPPDSGGVPQPGACEAAGGECVPTNYRCTGGIGSQLDCGAGNACGFGTCREPECTTNAQCSGGEICINNRCETKSGTPISSAQCQRVDLVADSATTVSQEMLDECTNSCPTASTKLYVNQYTCDGINLTGGCQDNGVILSSNASRGFVLPSSTPSCGTVQVDVGCRNDDNTWGNVAFLTRQASTACATTSTTTPRPTSTPPGLSAQCLEIKAFDTEWTQLTTTDLANLSAGDVVRFTVAGTATSGTIGKARFTINSVLRPEVTGKRPGTQEFFDEYTIPEGITSFSIKGEINHSTAGWF